MTYTMKRRCYECDKDMGEKPCSEQMAGQVTTTLCPECREEFAKKIAAIKATKMEDHIALAEAAQALKGGKK
jgi:hypothetical protein